MTLCLTERMSRRVACAGRSESMQKMSVAHTESQTVCRVSLGWTRMQMICTQCRCWCGAFEVNDLRYSMQYNSLVWSYPSWKLKTNFSETINWIIKTKQIKDTKACENCVNTFCHVWQKYQRNKTIASLCMAPNQNIFPMLTLSMSDYWLRWLNYCHICWSGDIILWLVCRPTWFCHFCEREKHQILQLLSDIY